MCEIGGRVKNFLSKKTAPPGRVGAGFSKEQQKAKEFIKKYNVIKDDANAIFLCYDESRKLTKEILESHAYIIILE